MASDVNLPRHLQYQQAQQVSDDVVLCYDMNSEPSMKQDIEHMFRTDYSLKPVTHTCNLCSYTSMKKYNVQTHVMKHMNIKPFKCRYCGYRSTFKKDVIKHAFLKHHSRSNKTGMSSYAPEFAAHHPS